MLNMSVDQSIMGSGEDSFSLTIGTLSLLTDAALATYFPPDTPVVLQLRPQLPPFMRVLPEEEPGHLEMVLGDLLIDFWAQPADGEAVKFITVALHLWITITLDINEAGELVPTMGVGAQADVDQELLIDLDDERVEQGVESIMAMVPSLLGDSFADVSIGEFAGIILHNPLFMPDGIEFDYFSVLADLAIAE